jgi:hypothetical protein
MPVSGYKIGQEEPVHFRINSFDPNPVPAPMSRPGERLLAVHVDMPHRREHINFPMLPDQFTPYLEAIEEAIRTQDLYWVDWNYENMGAFDHRPQDSTDWRVLRALADRQMVPKEAPPC